MHSMEVTDDMSLHLLHTSAPPMVTRSVSNTPSAVSDTLDLAGCSAFYTSERRETVEEYGSVASALVRMYKLKDWYFCLFATSPPLYWRKCGSSDFASIMPDILRVPPPLAKNRCYARAASTKEWGNTAHTVTCSV
ncbi:hypothetical protein BJ912DRAFT_929636 [Pholiota molesta]|nr:hypothetical protein BJ912DRAFT_929636 [Pholiota molesta]